MTAVASGRLGFLGARKLLAGAIGAPLSFTLAASGQIEPLLLYVRAHAALAGYDARIAALPFGTLGQVLHSPGAEAPEVLLLTPWDFVGELDWRSGIPSSAPDFEECVANALETVRLLNGWPRRALVYLPAATPPIFSDSAKDRELTRRLMILALELTAELLPADAFSLPSYLSFGCPVAGAALEEAGAVLTASAIRLIARRSVEPAKVLATDLDNVVWQGVIAEEGAEGIAFGQEGRGWRHFLYQTLVKRLRGEGVLVAAVSRNQPDDVLAPFRNGRMVLTEDDLVAVIASYHAKSAQLKRLAEQLSLDLDAFVFVDDNPVELAEVERELPGVRRLQFPSDETAMPTFLASLAAHFARIIITDEDRHRTHHYRQRVAAMVPAEASGADVTDFLRGLAMRMVIRDLSRRGDCRRAVQLINKTNQFNMNGRRWEDIEVAEVLASGGWLLTGELADRTGSHGEVLALLVNSAGLAESFVMSCRILLRRAEHAFLMALSDAGVPLRALRYAATVRNEPFRTFLAEPAFAHSEEGLVSFDSATFKAAHQKDRELITVTLAEPT